LIYSVFRGITFAKNLGTSLFNFPKNDYTLHHLFYTKYLFTFCNINSQLEMMVQFNKLEAKDHRLF